MVRIRARDKPQPAKVPDGLTRQPPRKRKLGGGGGESKDNVNSSNGTEASSRISKRTRTTQMPYQSPESVGAIMLAVTERRGRAPPKAKNETTPKRVTKQEPVVKAPPKRLPKPVKRLQKQATPTSSVVKPPLRRKLLKTPEPEPVKPQKSKPKSAGKAATKARTNKAKITKKLEKARKIVAKSTASQPDSSGGKKRKLPGSKGKSKQDDDPVPSSAKTKKPKRKGKLVPKTNLTLYEKDPTFESRKEIPFISTLSQSRLVIRAIILNDMKMLKKLVLDEPEKIFSLAVPRSASHDENVFDYICKYENKQAFNLLHKIPEKIREKFGSSPTILISQESTGRPSTMMFGHAMRNVSVGRGGKEGNNAFLYDTGITGSYDRSWNMGGGIDVAMKMGASLDFIEFLKEKLSVTQWNYTDVHVPLRKGHYEIAGEIIAQANERGGYGFNFLHEEVLTVKEAEALTEFKSVSVTKKCTYDPRFSPLHCAAINPNVEILAELLRSMPDYNLADKDLWTVGHYAAVCSGPEPLKYLLKCGISTHAVTSTKRGGDGYTLLHAAVYAGRAHNVKLILDHEMEREKQNKSNPAPDVDEDPKKKQKVLLQNDIRFKLTTGGQNALHMACALGHADIVSLLLEAETDPSKKTPAKQDCLTPLMLASMHGYLDIVEILVDEGEVKVDEKDKRGRTAAHHAAMNGQTHVLSYLLRLGCNHLAVDSSGNSLLHYSAAYGWYFATLLLLEAGCPPNAPNHWKMTPMAITFLKGHTGLVTELMKQEGVDVNASIDGSSGRTLLLETCATGWDLSRLKFLVEELKADPKCEDFNKNNALHLITEKKLEQRWNNDFPKLLKAFNECVVYLLEKGCNPFHKNIDETSPFLSSARKNNFHFISKLVEQDLRIPFEKDDTDNTLLHYMAQHLNYEDDIIYPTFTKLCNNIANSTTLKEMAATHNKDGMTPLLILLKGNSNTSNVDYKLRIQNLVDIFLDKLGVNVNAKVEGKGKSQMTLLHFTVGTYLLPTILKHKPYLDPVNDKSLTPLAMAVLNNQKQAAEDLINAGANVNFKFKEECDVGLLLYTAMKETHSFSLIPKLIAKGADPKEVHPRNMNSTLHYIASKPRVHYAAEALQAVLDALVSPNLVNCYGRTPIHVAVNARGSETDVFYDIEDALLTAGANLTIKDKRGRIPLHYCFVKKGDPINKTFFDPIELVSHLVTAMKSSGVSGFIHSTDLYGSTPLHYAAFRGATICSSFLMQTLPRGGLDIRDNNGNTPFGLSVRNAHEGCALNFFQKDADFLRIINNNIKIEEVGPAGLTTSATSSKTKSKDQIWKWEHKQKQDEESQRSEELKQKYPILEQVVKNDWQGLLYLMIGQLQSTGTGFSVGISTALKLQRLKLALKIAWKVKDKKELTHESGTLFHTLAKHFLGGDLEIAEKICEAFRKTGLNPAATDKFGSQASIYALINKQTILCEPLFTNVKVLATMKPDLFGRTPFTALFWDVKRLTVLEEELHPFAMQLLSNGADPNQLCEYPIKLTTLAGVRYSKKILDIAPSLEPRYPPLILAVIINCYKTVKWLLTMRKAGPSQVNVNAQDSEGRTAIMHAVRMNDLKMVKLLLDPNNYDYVEDKQKLKTKSTNIDLTIRDNNGKTVVDYLLFSPSPQYHYKNVEQILQLLQQIGQVINIASGDGLKALDKAIKNKRYDLTEIIAKYTPVPPAYRNKSFMPDQYSSSASVFSQDITLMPIKDYSSSAEKMAAKLMEEIREKLRKEGKDEVEKPKPDKLCGLEEDNAELMIDEKLNIPYDCLMTKVDLGYGIYGLYNFYKMQLIKQPRGKEMILLFTEWGRVGATGQYQKTPFATTEEAIKEFTKIFRQKSGNNWDDVQNFIPIPSKYRLVQKDLNAVKHSNQVAVNFKELGKAGENVRSSLPASILGLMKNLCDVHTDASSAYGSRGYNPFNENSPDYCNLPLLPVEVLVKGESILNSIGERIQKYDAMNLDTTGKYKEKDKMEEIDVIVKLSEEFYQLIPVYGFATQNLIPIFTEHDLRQKLIGISRLIHLEAAKSLLLGAQFHMGTTNPFEYVYRCVGTKIQLLDRANLRDKEEAELILQYIHNTGENAEVHGIYRVEIPNDDQKLNDTNIQNRQLLWHGTCSANLLSILQQGLQVAPLGSQISGHLFGKGIYLADIFEKSQHYCRTISVNGVQRKYMLLCEAALGKIYEVPLEKAGDKPMPKTFDSLKTSDSRYEPHPESTVVWKGRTVALGSKMERKVKEEERGSWYYGLDYNEYIIVNPDQVAVRYLIEFED